VTAALLTGARAIVYVQVPDAEEPTYEGREIVLGPRAGDYYLVKAGLKEGELVVTSGNFKLDSALQISAKPSMMTPEGGVSVGGHNHGGESTTSEGGGHQQSTAGGNMVLPSELKTQLVATLENVEAIKQAIEAAELNTIRESFISLGQHVGAIDPNALLGDMGDQLSEFVMLLGNDAVEGSDVRSLQEADRVSLVTMRHAERLQEMFGLFPADHQMEEAQLDVPKAFRQQLSQLIPPYLAIARTLAADDANGAIASVGGLHQVVSSLNDEALQGKTAERWQAEKNSLSMITARLAKANDLDTLRSAFALLSEQLFALQRSFGFAGADQLFELHCPMAFEGRGASWIQADDTVANPYYGVSMLKCADKVQPLATKNEHAGHSH
jgi:Cu(I)/Ag(I) efflux system membrane fusion protein